MDVPDERKVTRPVPDAQRLWSSCCDLLRQQVPTGAWYSTFQGAEPRAVVDGHLVVAVPSTVVKQRLEGPYRSIVDDALRAVEGPDLDLVVEVHTRSAERSTTTDPLDDRLGPARGRVEDPDDTSVAGAAPTRPVPVRVNQPRYTFDAFVIGDSNRFAHAAALRVAEMPGQNYSPLFIYGDAGLGKTHLLQAIGHYIRENYPGHDVMYISAEAFLNEFVEAIRHGTGPELQRKFRSVDVLLVDDIQFIEKTDRFQIEFFHTFNDLHDRARQIVLTSDRAPDDLVDLENRLRSRFKMGLMTDIQPPDIETRLAILRKKAERETIPVPDDVLDFIAVNVTDNIRELEGALNRVSAFANLNGRRLELEEAKRVLSDLIGDRQPVVITPRSILNATVEMFGFSIEELTGKSRQRPLVLARQIGMYVMRELTELSYPSIAREFGGRDHTTVMHAEKKITAVMKERAQVYEQVSELLQSIKKGV